MAEDKNEYLAMRAEITARVGILHSTLNWAALMLMVSLGFGYLLYLDGAGNKLVTYILFLPVIFATMAFNYQANQMTMEGVAYYLRDRSAAKNVAKDWENYYGARKRYFELISFLKIFPLLLPLLLPVLVWASQGWPNSVLDGSLLALDLALLLLVIFNFRYKWRR